MIILNNIVWRRQPPAAPAGPAPPTPNFEHNFPSRWLTPRGHQLRLSTCNKNQSKSAPTMPLILPAKASAIPMFKKRVRQAQVEKQVTVEDLSKQIIPVVGCSRFIVVLHNLLSPEECAALIRRAEDEGFDQALVTGENGEQILRKDIRSCGRCILDDQALADSIYQRIINALRGTELEKKMLHAPWTATPGAVDEEPIQAVGLNERMRFLRYHSGHFFAPHQDIRFIRGAEAGDKAGEISHLTCQIYLNEKFKGGTTRFISNCKRYYDVTPKTGAVLLFDHDLLHEGSKVTSGKKYSVRSDIMYTPRQEEKNNTERTITPWILQSGCGVWGSLLHDIIIILCELWLGCD